MACRECGHLIDPQPTGKGRPTIMEEVWVNVRAEKSGDWDEKKFAASTCRVCLHYHLLDGAIIEFALPEGCSRGISDIFGTWWRFGENEPLAVELQSLEESCHVTYGVYTTDGSIAARYKPWEVIPVKEHFAPVPRIADWARLAKGWLDHCMTEHHFPCKPSAPYGSPQLPTRVIAVGNSDHDPVLYETNQEHGQWVSLSYVWGHAQDCVTDTSNYASRLLGIPLDSLSTTIREAILLTRSIGIPYLWVDAICIVQDSVPDWEREAEQMCSVYANAVLTIAVLDSQDCHSGLIPTGITRTPSHIRTSKGLLYLEGEYHYNLDVAYSRETRPVRADQYQIRFSKTRKALVQRAWSMQELALSLRILWCCDTELMWSCASEDACECDPVPRTRPERTLLLRLYTHEHLLDKRFEKLLKSWKFLVEEYTRRNITEETDRLPALAGIAKFLGGVFGYRYFCGVWEVAIERQLLWHSSLRASDTSRRPLSIDYAPSWSFGSVTGPISYLKVPEHEATQFTWTVEDINFVPHGLNAFGPGSGTVRIRGFVVPAKLFFIWDDENRHRTHTLVLPRPSSNAKEWPNLCIACDKKESYCRSLVLDFRQGNTPRESLQTKDLFCITADTRPRTSECPEHRWGLLLEKVRPGIHMGAEYRRIGFWSTVSVTCYWNMFYKDWVASMKGSDFDILRPDYTFGTLDQWQKLGYWDTINIV